MRKTVGLALFLGMLALSPGTAAAEEDTHSIEQIEKAHTPADHAALAKHYRADAAEARANAARHQAMGKAYDKVFQGNEKLTWGSRGPQHCKKLSDASTAMATEYEALAKIHDEAAK